MPSYVSTLPIVCGMSAPVLLGVFERLVSKGAEERYTPFFSSSFVPHRIMPAGFTGGCYLNCHAILENPRPFDETATENCIIFDATLPTMSSDVDSEFVFASLCYHGRQRLDMLPSGMYDIHAKVCELNTVTLHIVYVCVCTDYTICSQDS